MLNSRIVYRNARGRTNGIKLPVFKWLGHTFLGNLSTDQLVIEFTKELTKQLKIQKYRKPKREIVQRLNVYKF